MQYKLKATVRQYRKRVQVTYSANPKASLQQVVLANHIVVLVLFISSYKYWPSEASCHNIATYNSYFSQTADSGHFVNNESRKSTAHVCDQ